MKQYGPSGISALYSSSDLAMDLSKGITAINNAPGCGGSRFIQTDDAKQVAVIGSKVKWRECFNGNDVLVLSSFEGVNYTTQHAASA